MEKLMLQYKDGATIKKQVLQCKPRNQAFIKSVEVTLWSSPFNLASRTQKKNTGSYKFCEVLEAYVLSSVSDCPGAEI
jgi:hypothetical protein